MPAPAGPTRTNPLAWVAAGAVVLALAIGTGLLITHTGQRRVPSDGGVSLALRPDHPLPAGFLTLGQSNDYRLGVPTEWHAIQVTRTVIDRYVADHASDQNLPAERRVLERMLDTSGGVFAFGPFNGQFYEYLAMFVQPMPRTPSPSALAKELYDALEASPEQRRDVVVMSMHLNGHDAYRAEYRELHGTVWEFSTEYAVLSRHQLYTLVITTSVQHTEQASAIGATFTVR